MLDFFWKAVFFFRRMGNRFVPRKLLVTFCCKGPHMLGFNAVTESASWHLQLKMTFKTKTFYTVAILLFVSSRKIYFTSFGIFFS